MNDFFDSWEEICSQTDQSTFNNEPIERHFKNSNCFHFSDPFFVVLDFIEREMTYPEAIREVVLTLSNGPTSEVRYMHLIDKWSTMPVSIGMIISLAPLAEQFTNEGNGSTSNSEWQLMDDDQNLYKNKLACFVNDSTPGIILYPHFLFKISSFGAYKTCPRAVFFRETHTFNNPTLYSLFGNFATLALQRYVKNQLTGNNVTAADIVDQLKRDFIIQLHHLELNQKDSQVNAIHSVNDFYDQVDQLAKKIDEKHNVMMTVPQTKRIITTSKAFPGFGATKYIEDETIWSFTQGLVGRPNCVVEINDNYDTNNDNDNNNNNNSDNLSHNETMNSSDLSVFTSPPNLQSYSNQPSQAQAEITVNGENEDNLNAQIVPIEVKGTIGKSDIGCLKNGHVFAISSQILLLSEKHHNPTNYGFVWYVGSNQKFWVHPRPLEEYSIMRQIRNIVACAITSDKPPLKQRTSDCDTCISRTICALNSRMYDKRTFIGNKKGNLLINNSEVHFDDIEDSSNFFNELLPISLMDLTQNMSRAFYDHYHRQIFNDALSSMWCSVRITTLSLEEREKRGYALSKLRITQIDSSQSLKQPATLFALTLIPNHPGDHYKLGISRLDSVIITKNGTMPILAFGNISEIKVDHIIISTNEKNFHVGEHITLDFYTPNQWYSSDNEILDSLLTDNTYSRIKGYIIDGNTPLFQIKQPKFNPIGLNDRQQEAVSRALSANDYLLINAPHGTGRIVIGLRIIDTLVKRFESIQILVTPFFYSTINKICAGLEILGIPYVIGGKIERIKEEYRKNHEDFLFSTCKTIQDTIRLNNSIKVFLIPSTAKKYDILFQREFNLVIMYESSRIPTIRSIPSLYSSCPLILFGDTVLDNGVDSIFAYFQRINAKQVLNLWEMYNCEPQIVAASRVAWGSELRCVSQHANILLKPLNAISDHEARDFFKKTLSMDHPIIFINVNIPMNEEEDEENIKKVKFLINPSVLMTITTSLVYSKDNKINVVADKLIQPLISSSLYFCQTNAEAVFSKYVNHMQKAMCNIKYYNANSVMSKRKDVIIAIVGEKPDPTILTLCLGMTRRKLILIGNLDVVFDSPLWATMLNTLPEGCIIDFPLEFVEREITPIKALNEIFPL